MEPSAPRPRAGRLDLLIFALCEQIWKPALRLDWGRMDCRFGELKKIMIFTENHDSA
jgi:hypothetical protein